ncbi:MAG: hypothetical protein U0230_16540 [Polyangiales bacterium]
MRCPSCGVPITAGANGSLPTHCPFCKSSLGGSADGSAGGAVGGNDDARLAPVREALARGNKIEAIKEYRAVFRVGLREAKDAVEAMAEGRDVAHPAIAATAPKAPPQAAPPAPESSAIPWMLIVAIVAFGAGLATGLYVLR